MRRNFVENPLDIEPRNDRPRIDPEILEGLALQYPGLVERYGLRNALLLLVSGSLAACQVLPPSTTHSPEAQSATPVVLPSNTPSVGPRASATETVRPLPTKTKMAPATATATRTETPTVTATATATEVDEAIAGPEVPKEITVHVGSVETATAQLVWSSEFVPLSAETQARVRSTLDLEFVNNRGSLDGITTSTSGLILRYPQLSRINEYSVQTRDGLLKYWTIEISFKANDGRVKVVRMRAGTGSGMFGILNMESNIGYDTQQFLKEFPLGKPVVPHTAFYDREVDVQPNGDPYPDNTNAKFWFSHGTCPTLSGCELLQGTYLGKYTKADLKILFQGGGELADRDFVDLSDDLSVRAMGNVN